jgi:hypothetical protein
MGLPIDAPDRSTGEPALRARHREMVGVNPEVAHETMAGLNFVHAVALALWAGKLFHIDALAARGAGHERIDQLAVERLLGV